MNFVKPFFLFSLSVLMLSISIFGSLYIRQTIKEKNEKLKNEMIQQERMHKNALRAQRSEYFLDAFKVELARIAYCSKPYGLYAPEDHKPRAIMPRSIPLIKMQMKSEGYSDAAIEMLYTQAEKEFLNLK